MASHLAPHPDRHLASPAVSGDSGVRGAPRPNPAAGRRALAAEGAAAGALAHYLRDISAHPLITRAREVELARCVRAGDRDALDALVRANLRFVVSVAKRYQNQGVALDDLIAEGNVGLIRAAQAFDEAYGVKFISYAVWWIRQAIVQALADQSRIMRVPLNRAKTLHRIGRRANALFQHLGREATHAEIAAGMDLSEADVAEAVALGQPHRSLDAPLGDGEDARLLDYLADENGAPPEEQAIAGRSPTRSPSRSRPSRRASAGSSASTSASTAIR
jgi:RNA polymerase primary sigma factor